MNNKYVILLLAIGILCQIYRYNKKNVDTEPATPGKYSLNNSYSQISAMKHDMFKQLTVDLSAVIILGLATQTEIFNMNDPLNTIVGRSLLAGLGYVVFYQLVQPYVVNYIPLY